MEKGFILSLIFAGIVGIFALSNSEKVAIDLIFTTLQISQAIVIFVSAFLGAIIVAILGWVRDLRNKKKIKELTKENDKILEDKTILIGQLKAKEKEIKSLYKVNTENAMETDQGQVDLEEVIVIEENNEIY